MKLLTILRANSLALALCFASPVFAASTTTITVGAFPKFVAVNQTTNRIYVSSILSDNVSVIDGASNLVIATVLVGNSPEAVDVNPITNMVYVANRSDNSVSVIDGGTNAVTATIKGLASPYGVAVNSVTNQIFVSNNTIGTVSVIDGATSSIVATVIVGISPAGVSVNSTANLVYVVNGAGTISVIDGQSDTVTNTFNLPQGSGANLVAFDPITNRLFVTNGLPPVVFVLDASTGTLLTTIVGGKVPFKSVQGIAIFQPGKSVLISDFSLNTVFQVNESTYAVSAGLKGGNAPEGIAVNRKTRKIYVTETGNGTVIVYGQ